MKLKTKWKPGQRDLDWTEKTIKLMSVKEGNLHWGGAFGVIIPNYEKKTVTVIDIQKKEDMARILKCCEKLNFKIIMKIEDVGGKYDYVFTNDKMQNDYGHEAIETLLDIRKSVKANA